MTESNKVFSFPRKIFRNEIREKSNYFSPQAININSTRNSHLIILSPRIHKKLKAKDLVFVANSAREISGSKNNFSNDLPKRYSSQNYLPPLKPTLHLAKYTPRKIPEEKNLNHMTITFSANQIKNSALF